MKKEEIHLWDIKRILFGQAPPEFLLEVFIRSLIVYIAALVVVRWMGKRMNGQLTIIEYAIMIMMGAILAVPMQMPDRGILQGLFVLVLTLFLLRGINGIAFKSTRFEKLVQGELTILIKDGVLQLTELRNCRITPQEIFAKLRKKNIYHLGKVKRMYLEACGIFSIYENQEPGPGLPVFPPDDPGMVDSDNTTPDDVVACINCGMLHKKSAKEDYCANCGNNEWSKAIL
jgi:uncharacterized membrane protein YcaP (DUF421 family)